MPEVILPCLNKACGGSRPFALKEYTHGVCCDYAYVVRCPSCGMQGPWKRDSAKEAIAAWNALPRMSALIAWQFQAAGAALENQRLKAILQGILDNDGGEKGFNAFELDKFRQQARAALETRYE